MKTLKNIYYFIQGTIRYKLYYSNFAELIPTYLLEQIDFRIGEMDKQCYADGQCKMCGCKTTALQMANKSCPKPCYPTMMNKKNWNSYKNKNNL